MGNLVNDLWPYAITVGISVMGTYFALVHGLNIRVTVLERRLEDIEQDMSKQDKKLDHLAEILSKMQADIASIKTTLNIIQPQHHGDQ